MKVKKTNNKKIDKTKLKTKKINLCFGIIYTFLLLGLLISSIIDNNLSDTETTNFVFFVIIFAIIELFLFLMFIHNLLLFKNKKKRLISYLFFIVNAVIFSLKLIFSADLMLLVMFIYNTLLSIYIAIDFTLYKTKHPTVNFYDRKILVIILFVFMLCISNTLSHNYVNSNIFWLYSLICMSIILLIFTVLSVTIFKNTYKKFAKKVGIKICVGFIAVIFSLCYGFIFVDIANTSFNNNPKQIECVIVDKNISGTGYRQITHYNLYVMLNDQKTAIDVSAETYKNKQIDDTLLVNFYNGNLKLSYYESAE